MTPSELKYNVQTVDGDRYFFDRKTMKCFGDTMRNYGVSSATIRTEYDADGNYVGPEGVEVEVWELYRKRAVKHGEQSSAYFRKDTFRRTSPAK